MHRPQPNVILTTRATIRLAFYGDVRISNYELKFTFPPQSTAAIEAWLNASCRPDDAHPTNTVSSIYYDTPDWRHLREKANGDYLKSKLRVRWYSRESSQSEGKISDLRCAYAELKRKIGSQRKKQRIDVDFDADWLEETALNSPLIKWLFPALTPR